MNMDLSKLDLGAICNSFDARSNEISSQTKQIDGMFEKAEKSKKNWMFYRGSIMPTAYVREHNQMTSEAYLEILKKYSGRILALTGTADLQADHESLGVLYSLPNATIFAPNGVNHMLRKVEGKNSMLDVMKQYKKQFRDKQSRWNIIRFRSFIISVR